MQNTTDSPVDPATISFPSTASISRSNSISPIIDTSIDSIPIGYKPFILEYAKKIAAKQCLLVNLKDKQVKYQSYIDSVTLPPKSPKTLVTAYSNALSQDAKLEFVRSACRNLDQTDQITKQQNVLIQLQTNYHTEVRLFLATAGIEESEHSLGHFTSWLTCCIRHHRLTFAANQLQTKKTSPITGRNQNMDEDQPEATVESLLARINRLEKGRSNHTFNQKHNKKQGSKNNGKGRKVNHNSSSNHNDQNHGTTNNRGATPNHSPQKGTTFKSNKTGSNKNNSTGKTGKSLSQPNTAVSYISKTTKPVTNVGWYGPQEKEGKPIISSRKPSRNSIKQVSNPNKLLSTDLPSIPNSGFTNLSDDNLTAVSKLLGYGLKFIPKPTKDISFQTLKPYLDNLTNKTLWRYFFSFQEGHNTRTEEFNPKLVSNQVSEYTGMMEPVMKGCITAFEVSIKTIINSTPPVKFKTHPSLQTLRKLSTDLPSTKIVAADKNLGLVAINTIHYHKLVMNHLSDTKTYRLLGPVSDNTATIADIIKYLHPKLLQNVHIRTKQEERYLSSPRCQLPKFHIIPKIHKSPLKGRPIVGATDWVTTPFSIMLDLRLQERMLPADYPSILKNSNDLISRWLNQPFDPELDWLVSLDVSSLYTNIDIPRAVEIISSINPVLGTLAKLIMENNYFTYNNQLYHQIQGIAMGTNAAVVIANLYMSVLIDSKLRILPNIRSYCRFIDDIGFIFRGNEQALLDLIAHANQLQPGIIFTHVYSKTELDILDLTFYPHQGKLAHKTFQKSMNKYLYIPPFSYHPKPTIRGFIIGELTRYHRTNSFYTDELAIRHLFFRRLLLRGYSQRYLDTILKDFTSNLGFKNNNEGNHLLINPRNSVIAASSPNSTLYCPLPFIPTPRTKSIISFIRSRDNPLLTLLPNEVIKTVWSTLPSISRLVLRSNLSTAQSAYLASHLLPPTEDNGHE